MIRTLLEDAQLWLDFEGVKGEALAIVNDFGVVGVDCVAMVKNLGKHGRFEVEEREGFLEEEEAKAFQFKMTLLPPPQFSRKYKKDPG
jgi:hypothetical protein